SPDNEDLADIIDELSFFMEEIEVNEDLEDVFISLLNNAEAFRNLHQLLSDLVLLDLIKDEDALKNKKKPEKPVKALQQKAKPTHAAKGAKNTGTKPESAKAPPAKTPPIQPSSSVAQPAAAQKPSNEGPVSTAHHVHKFTMQYYDGTTRSAEL